MAVRASSAADAFCRAPRRTSSALPDEGIPNGEDVLDIATALFVELVAAVEDIIDALETTTAEVEGRPIIDARVVAVTLRDALTPKCDLCRTFYGGGSIPHHDLELGCAPTCPCQPTHDCTALAATPEDER